jgi:hypothetical protein
MWVVKNKYMHSLVDPDRLVHSIVDNILSAMPGPDENQNPSMPHEDEDAANPDPAIKFAAAMIISFEGGQMSILTEMHPPEPGRQHGTWTMPMDTTENHPTVHGYGNPKYSGALLMTLWKEIIPRVLEKVPAETRNGIGPGGVTGIGRYPFFDIRDKRVFFCDYSTLTSATKDHMETVGQSQFKWLIFPYTDTDIYNFPKFNTSPLLTILQTDFALVSNRRAMANLRDIRSILRGGINGTGGTGMPLTGTTTMWDELWGAYRELLYKHEP